MDASAQLLSRMEATHHLIEQGDFAAAETAARESVQRFPHDPRALYQLSTVCRKLGRPREALEHLAIAERMAPQEAMIAYDQGLALIDLREFEQAIDAFKRAVRLRADFQEAYVNINAMLEKLERFEEAVPYAQKAIELRPTCHISHYNYGNLLRSLNRLDDAIESYRQAMAIKSDYPSANANLGITLLMNGEFAEGWEQYEWRTHVGVGEVQHDNYQQTPWNGSNLAGKTLLVHAEQGIGDEILFASCYPDLLQQAKRCLFVCDMRLVPIYQRSFPRAEIIGWHRRRDLTSPELAGVDFQIAAGSVPRFLRRSLADFPERGHFLLADPGQVNWWRKRYEALGPGLKIGISWRAGGKPTEQRKRTTGLEQWQSLFAVPGTHWVNLQYGDTAEDLAFAKDQLGVNIHDWPEGDSLVDMDAFAAKVRALDLVISVGNATVHLAGALGVPAWTILPMVPAWRWMTQGHTSPWYNSVRLFRQKHQFHWEPVFAEVTDQLRHLLGHSGTPEPIAKSSAPAPYRGISQAEVLDVSDAGLDTQVRTAVAHFEQGRIAESERGARRVLTNAPRHPNALRLLAAIALRTGRVELAIQSFKRAISLEPNRCRNWIWLGECQLKGNLLQDAQQSFARALELDAQSCRARLGLASVHIAQREFQQVIDELRAVEHKYGQQAHFHVVLGQAQKGICQLDEAIASFRQAMLLEPTHAASYLELASALSEDGCYDEAAGVIQDGLRALPEDAALHRCLGHILAQAGKLEASLDPLRRAAELDPERAETWALLGETLTRVNQPEQAHECLIRGVGLEPENAELRVALARVLVEQGNAARAKQEFEKAMELNPESNQARFQLAMLHLQSGNFAAGWDLYEHRWQGMNIARTRLCFHAPTWHGEELASKTVVVYGEQGIGDEVMFASCLEDMIERAEHCIVICERRLAALFARSFPQATVIGAPRGREYLAPLPAGVRVDYQTAIGSLPRLLRRQASAFPRRPQYLTPCDRTSDQWWQRLTELGPGPKIGIAWQGGTGTSDRRYRWTALRDWLPILRTPHAHFVSLQHGLKGDPAAELRSAGATIHHFPELWQNHDLEQLSGLIANLDLVISVTNTNVHLAGSLGIPTWALIPKIGTWRWPSQGDANPWYPSVRLFRQAQTEPWSRVFERVAEELVQADLASNRYVKS